MEITGVRTALHIVDASMAVQIEAPKGNFDMWYEAIPPFPSLAYFT